MKIVFIKAHENFKVGDEYEVSAKQASPLLDEGFAITASEWQAKQEVIEGKKAEKTSNENKVKEAIVKAKADNKIEPKDETIQAKCLGWLEDGSDLSLVISHIESLPVKASLDNLGKRATSGTEAPQQVTVGASLEAAGEGYIKATEPMSALIKNGDFKEAFVLARERATIMRSEISPILAKGGNFMLKSLVKSAKSMGSKEIIRAVQTDPNSQLGTISTGLMLAQDLGFLMNKVNFLRYISTDFSDKPARFGEPIYSRYKSPPDVLTYVPGVGFTSDATAISVGSVGTTQSGHATATASAIATTPTNYVVTKSVPSTTDVTVTLNQLKSVDIEFGLDKLSSTVRDLFGEQKGMQTYALAEKIAQHFMATIYGATWSGTVTSYAKALANWDLKSLIAIKAKLGVSKVPDVGRFLILHTFYHDKLYEDASMMSAKAILSLINRDQTIFESTDVPAYVGIKPIETQLASAVSGTLTAWTDDTSIGTINQVGFAGNMSSAVFVSRVPQDFTSIASQLGIPATAAIEIVSEPETGISMMVFKYMDLGKMSIVCRVLLMWGDAQGDPRIGIVITPS